MKRFRLFLTVLMGFAFLPALVRADLVKQNTAYNRTILVQDSSGVNVTGLASGAFTVKISKAGGVQSTITPTITEQGLGRYSVALVSGNADTLGALDLVITASGIVQVDTHDQVYDPVQLSGQSGDAYARLGTPAGASLSADVAAMFARIGAPTGASMAADIQTRLPTSGYTTPPTVSQITTDILNATAATYNTAGSIGAKINTASAGAANDPFANLTSTSYAGGTFGALLKTSLDAAVSSRLASGNVTVGAYAAGQEPETRLMAVTVYGGLTFKQMQAVNFALQLDASRTWNATTHTSVYTWFVRTGINTVDLTKPLVTKTTVYDSTNTQIVTQTTNIVAANLP